MVRSDVTLNMDKGKVTVVILFELSVAFDSFDHIILVYRRIKIKNVCPTPLLRHYVALGWSTPEH